MTQIVVIDYGLGNIRSILGALNKSDVDIDISNDKEKILSADGLILPGVGAFAYGMEGLKAKNIDIMIHEFVATEKPLLGICLGMQMLFDSSTEFGDTQGLGIIPGQVLSLKNFSKGNDKLPHISWSEIRSLQPLSWEGTILNGVDDMENMYFVHSYYAQPENKEDILSTSLFSGVDYCSTVKHRNVYGCQYHPEKSAECGLKIISNFVNICRG
jgi:imidazole glycerol-phosphate synthase subunit HisH